MTMQVDISRRQLRLPRFVEQNRVLLNLVLAHLALAVCLSQFLETPFQSKAASSLIMVLGTMMPIFILLLVLGRFIHLAVIVRPKRPTQHMISDARNVLTDFERLASGMLAIGLFSLFISTFSYLKTVIPEINPFDWDVRFAELDRALHFGFDPYGPLMAVLGKPLIVTVVNGFYHAWLFIVCMSVMLAAFIKRDMVLRNTYLIGFVLVWFLGGNLLATVFSSAGPIYFERLGLGNDFVPLVDMLHNFHEISPVWALNVHQMLWDGYVGDATARGISAMPSMHVASSALMMFFAYEWNRLAGHLMAAFCAIIMIGSVMLAWHYAVDGYLGFFVAWVCWKLARRIAARDLLN